MPASRSTVKLDSKDLLATLGIALAVAVLYFATIQPELYGDGPAFATLIGAAELNSFSHHLLYVPAGVVVRDLGPSPSNPADPLRWLSALGAALGVACTYLVCRAFGSSRTSSILACALIATCPAVWFFATTIEVHAFHFGMVALSAAATLLAPWKKPILAALLTALAFPLLYTSHQTGILLTPGWLFLILLARARSGCSTSPRAVFLIFGPLLFLLAAGTLWGASRLRGLPFFEGQVKGSLGIIHGAQQPFRLEYFWEGWIAPLAFVTPVAVAGLVAGARRRFSTLTLLVLLAVPGVFFVLWGLPERGAYLLGLMPFIAVFCSSVSYSPRPLVELGVGILLGMQAAAGYLPIEAYNAGFVPGAVEERDAFIESVIGPAGVVIVVEDRAVMPATVALPGVFHKNIWFTIEVELALEKDPERVARKLLEVFKLIVHPWTQVALLVDYRMNPRLSAGHRACLAHLEELLGETFRVEPHPHPRWPLLRIHPR